MLKNCKLIGVYLFEAADNFSTQCENLRATYYVNYKSR